MGNNNSTGQEQSNEISQKTGCTFRLLCFNHLDSKEEIEKKRKEFNKYSTDGKSLTPFDLKKWAQATSTEAKLLIPFGHDGDYQALFRTFDVDSNGFVDFFEFCWITYFLQSGSSSAEERFKRKTLLYLSNK